MKIVSWNVNSLKVRLPQLLDFLATRQPDVVCLQETKLTDDKFPAADLEAAGYHVAFVGQKPTTGSPSSAVANLPISRSASPIW